MLVFFLTGYLFELSAQTNIYTADLDTVFVQISRQPSDVKTMPYSISIVDSNSLSRINNLTTIKDLFNSVPGMNVSNRFNPSQGDKIIIRGIGSRAQFGVRGIKILLDGIPLTFPDGQSQLNNLNPGGLEKIEILRGPNSTLYGNSSGGVIFITSNVLSSNGKIRISPEFNVGSFGFRKYSVGLSGKFLKGAVGINLFTVDYEGVREHSEAKFSGINFITAQHLLDDLKLNFVANYFNSPYLLNPGSLNKRDAGENPEKARDRIINSGSGKDVEQLQAGISLRYDLSSNSVFNTTFYGIHRSLLNAITTRVIDLERFSYGIRSTFSFASEFSLGDINLITGFDYEVQDDERIEFENEGITNSTSIKADEIFDNINYGEKILEQDEVVKSVGVFSQLEFLPSEKIKLIVGLRYDSFNFEAADNFLVNGNDSGERVMDKLSPIVGASYKFSERMILYGNLSTAFQTPTTNELSNKPDGAGGFNESIVPENIESFEIGFRGSLAAIGLNYDAVLYKMNIDDVLIPFQNDFEETFYRNSGKSTNNGLELSLSWSPFNAATAGISYTYQDMKFDEFLVERNNQSIQLGGNRVPGIPKHYFNFRFNSQLLYGLSAEMNFNAVSRIYANDLNGPAPGDSKPKEEFINDGYSVVSLIFIYSTNFGLGKANLKAGIENLFDKQYNGGVVPNAFGNNFFEPAAGRSFYLSLNFNIN